MPQRQKGPRPLTGPLCDTGRKAPPRHRLVGNERPSGKMVCEPGSGDGLEALATRASGLSLEGGVLFLCSSVQRDLKG